MVYSSPASFHTLSVVVHYAFPNGQKEIKPDEFFYRFYLSEQQAKIGFEKIAKRIEEGAIVKLLTAEKNHVAVLDDDKE